VDEHDSHDTALKAILIADGDESVAELFAYVFASDDWRVTRYGDGKRAGEELCGRTHYDAVLVSYRFDDMNGVELIKLIRALDHRKDVPIVMVTGTVGLDVATAALTAGADHVLYKPIDLAILTATVSKCLERGKHRGA
jgi:DNA-binding response OmpR family regulator